MNKGKGENQLNKDSILCQVAPSDIDRLNRIFEGMDGLGIVSTLDRRAGLVIIRVTPDTYVDAKRILDTAPFAVEIRE